MSPSWRKRAGIDLFIRPPPVTYSNAKTLTPATLDIIPVVDLKGGEVVHARRGERGRYAPLRSVLTASTRPARVLRALLDACSFSHVYLADLDAITRQDDTHLHIIQELRQQFPAVEFWIDRGLPDRTTLQAFLTAGLGTPVLGSESLVEAAIAEAPAWHASVLSLDYRGARALGPAWIEQRPAAWPARVILMDLERVGSGEGPDFARLAALQARAAGRRIYAAGGVRDAGDLDRLRDLGIAGVLLASALHDGRLSPAALARYC